MKHEKVQTLIHLDKYLKVLYVEDNDIVRESTYDMMKEFFTHVDVAKDGVDGLQKYKKFRKEHDDSYDIVFSDINMPRMDGIEMSELILIENELQNIVMISAHDESEYLLKLINMGISNFILKPIEMTRFQNTVSKVKHNVLNEKMLKLKQQELLKINHLLKVAREEAKVASLQKSRFLANISHEIRTPMNAITGFISLLGEDEIDPEKLKYFNVIQNSSNLLLHIINDMLDISKIENGKMELDLVTFSPYDDLLITGELFQAKAYEKGVDFQIQFNNTIPKVLYGDISKIKQIISHLLSNAIKFTPKGANVKCIIWYYKGKLNIRVKDYGIGISDENQKYIFETFSQVESSVAREYGGTGLGLNICTKLTDILGGDLIVHSQEDKGSIFHFSLEMPLVEDSKEHVSKESSNADMLNKKHILIVDDNETNIMFIGIILNNVGITYESAINGEEAIEKFKQEDYDLILMDENMPKLSGTGATKVILEIEKKNKSEHTPIISLTANALNGDRKHFLNAGMDDYMSKPIEPNVLLQVIRKFI